jgi:anti-sigma factor RsiW
MDAHIEAYVDGSLSPEEQARFDAGLRADPAWQVEVEHAHAIRAFLRTQSPPPPPADLTAAILSRVSTSVSSK